MEAEMEERLMNLRIALQNMKKASVFKKALVAEEALLSAMALMEQMVVEIEELKREKESAGK